MKPRKTNMAAVVILSVIVLILAALLVYSGLRYQNMAQKLQSSQEELDQLRQEAEKKRNLWKILGKVPMNRDSHPSRRKRV